MEAARGVPRAGIPSAVLENGGGEVGCQRSAVGAAGAAQRLVQLAADSRELGAPNGQGMQRGSPCVERVENGAVASDFCCRRGRTRRRDDQRSLRAMARGDGVQGVLTHPSTAWSREVALGHGQGRLTPVASDPRGRPAEILLTLHHFLL